MINYCKINKEVMLDTKKHYESDPELQKAVKNSIRQQYMVAEEEDISVPVATACNTKYVVSGKRSFEAAKAYKGKRVAVLNFANNHSIGGAPFSAGAQEESLCRCSTLLPCLEAMKSKFYDKHRRQYENGEIDFCGNDDLIYTPNVVVFKSDELTEPIYPKMIDDWYKVNIITSAAPEIGHHGLPENYEQMITSRIKKILDVAAREHNEVLILGAWGCGAFKNPIEIVARIFFSLLRNYDFEIVEFALSSKGDISSSPFAKYYRDKEERNIKDTIISLLESTGRENINTVIQFLEKNGFFDVPASVQHHNNFAGGLAKHSLEVYREAMKLNEKMKLPVTSVTLCSLLHDVCKYDQFAMSEGHPTYIPACLQKGHGHRSMFILTRRCGLPLNYDEAMAIWWHMGKFEPSKERYQNEYKETCNIPLCTLIQQADSIATQKDN